MSKPTILAAPTTKARAFGAKAKATPSLYRDAIAGARAHWIADAREVFSGKHLGADILSGITVAAVALPLNLALAVASGLPPVAGMISGAFGGIAASIMGGSALQVTGPAAALSVMVLAIAREFGTSGVAAACLIVGLTQWALSLSLSGKLSKHFPESVLAGFTTGVGLKLLDAQIPELLGFNYRVFELAQMLHRPHWLREVSWVAVVAGLSVAMLVTGTAKYKRFPAAIVGISIVTFVSVYVGWNIERIGALPTQLPSPSLPHIPADKLLPLALKAVPLGVLAAIESLLAARAVDRMLPQNRPHDPNLELLGQGAANLVVGFFGGMPVSGVVVRSGVNVQSGAKTRFSAFLHGVLLILAVLFLSRQLSLVPLSALAGLLCVVGLRLLELHVFFELAQKHRLEALAFVAALVGTVTGHLMIGLVAGGVLHALHRYLNPHEGEAAKEREPGLRAVLDKDQVDARKHHPEAHPERVPGWLRHIRGASHIASTAYVHEKATVIGRVVLGEHVHVAAGSSVRADEGTPFFLGDNTNVQDGVVIHALKDKHVMVRGEAWAVYVGRNVSIAHDALVHGPCYIGDDTFIGFKAVVHDSVVGKGCFIGIGAVVVGVEIPDGKRVPHGMIVDTADAVDRLPDAEHAHHEFNEDVVEVNRGLALAYQAAGGEIAAEAPLKPRAERKPPKPWDEAWNPSRPGKDSF
jgi:SulP family sulfate permease